MKNLWKENAKRILSIVMVLILGVGMFPAEVNASTTENVSWPQLTSFNITSGQVKAGAVSSLGLEQKLIDVTGVEIVQNEALEMVNEKSIAGKVVISVGEDFSVRKAIQVQKNDWTATYSEGAELNPNASTQYKAINMQSTKDYVYPAALELVSGTTTVYYDVAVVFKAPWPQLTSFNITSGQVKAGAVSSLGLEQKLIDVTGVEIVQNTALETVDEKNIAGQVILSVGEDFSVRKAIQVQKADWTATYSEGAELNPNASTQYKAINMQSTKDYVSPAALELVAGTTTVYYDVKVVSTVDNTGPTLEAVADGVSRTSDKDATVLFTSNEAGTYFHAVAGAEDTAPEIDTSAAGATLANGENSLVLSDLTAGAKKLYIKGKDAAGNVTTDALVIDIPEYIPPTYSLSLSFGLSVSAPKFQYATVNGNPADFANNKIEGIAEGDTVRVWMNIPQVDGEYYDLATVSLITDDDTKTAIEAVTVHEDNSFSFMMPDTNVRGALGNWSTTEKSTKAWHSLNSTVSLLFPDLEDKESNRKGTVVYTDSNGVPITRALKDTSVTVTASARDAGSHYEFKFEKWNDATGIEIPEDKKTDASFTFTMPEGDVTLDAEFKNVGTEINLLVEPADSGIVLSAFGNSEYYPFTYRIGEKGTAYPYSKDWVNEYKFEGWTIVCDGKDVSNNSEIVTYKNVGDDPDAIGYYEVAWFTTTGSSMTFTANFSQRAFASVSASVNDTAMGSASVTVDTTTAASIPVVYEDQTVTLTATPGERYTLDSWTVTDADGTAIVVTTDSEDANKATFTMPDTGKNITAVANFKVDPAKASKECLMSAVALYNGSEVVASGSKQGTTYTITLPADADVSKLSEMVLKFTYSDYATVKKSGDTEKWPAEGKACTVELDTPTTFTVTAEDGTTTADYTVTIVKTKSTAKEITKVELLDKEKEVLASGTLKDSTWTLTLPEDTDAEVIRNLGSSTDYFLKVTHTGVSAALDGGLDDASGNYKWSEGDVMCPISANSSGTFTVKAEDGSTKEYTIEILFTLPDAATISGGTAERTSDTQATVTFTSSEAGTYYYKVVSSGADAPTINTVSGGKTAAEGKNTISLTNLTAGARDIYIVVKNAYGVESAAYKLAIPAYGSSDDSGEGTGSETGTFTITDMSPNGGKLTPSKAKADKGDTITITVTPDSGMQMVEGSLSYTIAIAGGATTKITGNSFTMPSGSVTLTCQWETAEVVTEGITGFSISGVNGAVNNATNTISVTMPYGTNVSSLTPAISGNGIKSISPASGTAVDFTKPVTYTVTMEDGSVKTYTVTVYVQAGTAADQMWDKLTDFYHQVPWWKYAETQQSKDKYPKYWD